MGDAVCAPKNGGLNIHTNSIAAQAKGGPSLGNKRGGTHILQQTNINNNWPWHQFGGKHKNVMLGPSKALILLGQLFWGTDNWSDYFQRQATARACLLGSRYGPEARLVKGA